MDIRNLHLFFLVIAFIFIDPCHAMEKKTPIIKKRATDTQIYHLLSHIIKNNPEYNLFVDIIPPIVTVIHTITKTEKKLNWIEREIFIAEMQKPNGVRYIKKQLDNMKKSKDYYLIIDSDLYPNHKSNVLNKMIYEGIKYKEKKEPYRSITDKNNDSAVKKNNFLGDYTEYWHKTDEQGKSYIRCITIFTKKEVLEDIFETMQSIYEKEKIATLLMIEETYSPKKKHIIT